METVDPATPAAAAAWTDRKFETIYEEHSRAIYYLCLRLLSDSARAEDATHDVFLKAFRKLDQFRGTASIRTWLYRIAINHCHNQLTSWHQRKIQFEGDLEDWNAAGSHSETPFRALDTKELGERIQKALDALADEYKLLLLLVADEKLSYEEVGALTSQTADAVRGKLHRARKAFAVEFKKSA